MAAVTGRSHCNSCCGDDGLIAVEIRVTTVRPEFLPAMTIRVKTDVFFDVMHCSFVDKGQYLGEASLFHLHGIRRINTTALKMETAGSPETSVQVYQIIRRHIPENSNL
jgi:hypothetical protein